MNPWLLSGALGVAIAIGITGYVIGGNANDAKWQRKWNAEVARMTNASNAAVEAANKQADETAIENENLNKKVDELELKLEQDTACVRLVDPDTQKALESIR